MADKTQDRQYLKQQIADARVAVADAMRSGDYATVSQLLFGETMLGGIDGLRPGKVSYDFGVAGYLLMTQEAFGLGECRALQLRMLIRTLGQQRCVILFSNALEAYEQPDLTETFRAAIRAVLD